MEASFDNFGLTEFDSVRDDNFGLTGCVRPVVSFRPAFAARWLTTLCRRGGDGDCIDGDCMFCADPLESGKTIAGNGRIRGMNDGGECQQTKMKAKKKYKVGITVGVFDLFHVGHLNLLERCKAMCDKLIVAVCDDDYVTDVKKKTPVHPEDQRCRILAALKCVDEVVLVSIDETEDKVLLLKNHPFDVLFSGDDWKGSERYVKTEEQFAKNGVAIEYLPYTQGISTTEIKTLIGK